MESSAEITEGPGIDASTMGISGYFSNHFQVTVMGDITRIVFGEKYPGSPEKFHSAIVIPTSGAKILADVIPKAIAKNQDLNRTKPAVGEPGH